MRHNLHTRPRARGERAGQTLVIALSVMFLLFFIGALFVAMIARNINRVEYAGNRTSAASLAESGLNWVNSQLTYSELGADWRPSPTWPAPGNGNQEQVRQRDPDYPWLSDGGSYLKPWTRIPSGDGRFLIRVDYEPGYHSTKENDQTAFDSLSGDLHIEVVGRPGRIEDDPTLLLGANNPGWKPGVILGAYNQLEAWKPIGLTDQLLWITNINKERGPAVIGVPPFQDGAGQTVVAPQEYQGGLRSNMDLMFEGPTTFDVDPGSGQGIYVAGDIRMGNMPGTGGATMVPVTVNYPDEAKNNVLQSKLEAPSDSPNYNPIITPITGRGVFLDSLWLTDNTVAKQRSIRYLEPPSIDLTETGSADSRYRKMTEGTGTTLKITANGASRAVNTGDYGFGDGIYVDNVTDIQHPENRDAVVDEWLRRGPADAAQTGWVGSFYTPSVRESGTVHPILDVELLPQGIRMTRYDRDIHGRNLEPDNQYKTRIFYKAVSKNNPNLPPAGPTDIDPTKGLQPVGSTILMPYPPNGVLYAEGSLRIRGQIGRLPTLAAGGTLGSQMLPVDLTVVSGGSIYIEGSLLNADPASHLALLAHDYVTLNPTQFTAIRPYEDVTIEPDGAGSRSFHYSVPQDKDLDLVFTSSAPLQGPGMLLNLQQSAGFSDNSSTTSVSMYVNGLDPGNRYDFSAGGMKPPYPAQAGGGGGGNPYMFQFFAPPADPNWWLQSWGVSNYQSSTTTTVNYERKSFWIPRDMLKTGAGQENTFRLHVDPTPGGQPWWLASASLVPYHAPLGVEVDAVAYAQTGSWFVVPTPWFNDNPLDSREVFLQGDSANSRNPGTRAAGTFPANSDDYPFYREPLNIQVTVKGSITEGKTTQGTDKAQWMKKMTMDLVDPAQGKKIRDTLSLPTYYQPKIQYVYDQNLRDWVRYRNVVTGVEGIAYTGPAQPGQPIPPGAQRLDTVRAAAMKQGENIVTLPILPRLPTSGTLYRGRPL